LASLRLLSRRLASFSCSVSSRAFTVAPDGSLRDACDMSPLLLRPWPWAGNRRFVGLDEPVELASLPSPGVSGNRPDEPVVDPLGDSSRATGHANGLVGGWLGSGTRVLCFGLGSPCFALCFVFVGEEVARGDRDGGSEVDAEEEVLDGGAAEEILGGGAAAEALTGTADVDTDGEIRGVRELDDWGISDVDDGIRVVGLAV
jgi:hypothetical protein